jgi:hypothetical protein
MRLLSIDFLKILIPKKEELFQAIGQSSDPVSDTLFAFGRQSLKKVLTKNTVSISFAGKMNFLRTEEGPNAFIANTF